MEQWRYNLCTEICNNVIRAAKDPESIRQAQEMLKKVKERWNMTITEMKRKAQAAGCSYFDKNRLKTAGQKIESPGNRHGYFIMSEIQDNKKVYTVNQLLDNGFVIKSTFFEYDSIQKARQEIKTLSRTEDIFRRLI